MADADAGNGASRGALAGTAQRVAQSGFLLLTGLTLTIVQTQPAAAVQQLMAR